jgi:hypothetical protein
VEAAPVLEAVEEEIVVEGELPAVVVALRPVGAVEVPAAELEAAFQDLVQKLACSSWRRIL